MSGPATTEVGTLSRSIQWAADHAARPRRTAHQRLLRTRILIMLVSAWVIVPRLVQSLAVAKVWLPAGSDRRYVTAAALTLDVLLLAVLAFAGLMIMEALTDPPTGRAVSLWMMLTPWLWLSGQQLVRGGSMALSDLVYPLVVAALWTLRPAPVALRTLGWVVLVVVVASVALGALAPDRGLWIDEAGHRIGLDKQLVPVGVLVGIFTQGNSYGQFVLLGLPLLAALATGRARGRRRVVLGLTVAALALAGLSVAWSASRTAGVGLVLVAAVGAWMTAVSIRLPRSARVLGGVVAGGALAMVALVPVGNRDPELFTRRGWIWIQSLRAWEAHPVVGLGPDWYARSAQTSARLGDAVFHAHNEFVQLLVTGGLVLVIMVVGLMALAVRAAVEHRGTARTVWVCWLVALALASLTEVSMAFVDNQSLVPVFVLPLALLLFSDRSPTSVP